MIDISRESEINLINILIDQDIISGKDLIDIKKASSEGNKSQLDAVFELNLTDEEKILDLLVKEQSLQIVDLSKMEDSVTIYLDEEAFYCSPSDYLFSPFGPRRGRQHKGIDTDLDIGDTLRTMFDGKVRYTNYVKGFGNLVIIRHFNGLETYYAHLDKILISADKIVKAGDVIGLGGETGNALGPHLHFEFRYKDNAFDPEKIIDLKNQKLKTNVLILTKKDFEWKKQWRERKYYKVKSGDTLGHIAQKHNTSVSKILKINKGLSVTSILQIGQNIRVR